MIDDSMKQIVNRPFYYDFFIEGDTIYFPMLQYNALCRGNLINNQVEIMNVFPDIPSNQGAAYVGIYKTGNHLLFCPYNGVDDVVLYDIIHCAFSKVNCNRKILFYGSQVFEKGKDLYIVSRNTAEIYKVDVQMCSATCINPEYVINNPCIYEIIRIGDLIYIPINKIRKLMVFNMQNEKFSYYNYPSNISSIKSICDWNSEFWITGETRKLYLWNIKKEKALECGEFPDSVHLHYPRKDWFGYSLLWDNVLWLFPNCTDGILKYNISTKVFEQWIFPGEEESNDKVEKMLKMGRPFPAKFGTVNRYGNEVFLLSSKTRILYELNIEKNRLKKHLLHVNHLYHDQIYPSPEDGLMKEEYYMDGFRCFVNSIGKDAKKTKQENKKTEGEILYDQIKGK